MIRDRRSPGEEGDARAIRLGYVFTNFNNSRYTEAAVRSIAVCENGDVSRVYIVDNASEPRERELLARMEREFPAVNVIYNGENAGYFPGLNVGLRALRSRHPRVEHVVIGNNDLVFPPEFLEQVRDAWDRFATWAVISPDLITLDGIHQNPHVLERISPLREIVWDIYFTSYGVARLIQWAARVSRRLTERKDYEHHATAGPIYQGYGACYILGPVFFANFSELWAPTFLMGEEFFLAKQLEGIGQRYFYEPSIVVHHHDHAATAKVPGKRMWEICKDAHREYRKHVRVLPWG